MQNDRLPRGMHRKHGAYYFVRRVAGKVKWTRLAADLPAALREYARRLEAPVDRVPALLLRYLDDAQIADKTRRTYSAVVRQLSEIMAEFEPAQVTARDVMATMHAMRDRPGMANHARTVLIGALDLAFLEGAVERNVARDVRPLKVAARDRYISDAEFDAIYAKASESMRLIMDLAFLTGQRIGDLLKLKWADVSDDGIAFRQEKTKNRLVVAWSPELRAVIDRARSRFPVVRGLFVIQKRDGGPLAYWTARTLWDRATAAAGVSDAHIHDIRAKSATDSKAAGGDSKTLLGHKSESSHNRYLRSREVPIATPARRKSAA